MVTVRPLSDALGAELCSVDLDRVDETMFGAMMIDGPKIMTPGRNTITGDYGRDRFSYTLPANAPGGEIKMLMLRG